MNTTIFQNSLAFQPDIVIIMLGTNDAQPNLEIYNTSFVNDYITLVSAFQELPSKPRIWIVLPPPIFSNQSGKLDPEYFRDMIVPNIELVADETNSTTIDLFSRMTNYSAHFPDGVHPDSLAAKKIAEEIFRTLISENIANIEPRIIEPNFDYVCASFVCGRLKFKVGVWLNFGQQQLDSHQTFRNP